MLHRDGPARRGPETVWAQSGVRFRAAPAPEGDRAGAGSVPPGPGHEECHTRGGECTHVHTGPLRAPRTSPPVGSRPGTASSDGARSRRRRTGRQRLGVLRVGPNGDRSRSSWGPQRTGVPLAATTRRRRSHHPAGSQRCGGGDPAGGSSAGRGAGRRDRGRRRRQRALQRPRRSLPTGCLATAPAGWCARRSAAVPGRPGPSTRGVALRSAVQGVWR